MHWIPTFELPSSCHKRPGLNIMTRNWKTWLTLAFTGKIYFRILGLDLGLDTSGLVNIPSANILCGYVTCPSIRWPVFQWPCQSMAGSSRPPTMQRSRTKPATDQHQQNSLCICIRHWPILASLATTPVRPPANTGQPVRPAHRQTDRQHSAAH